MILVSLTNINNEIAAPESMPEKRKGAHIPTSSHKSPANSDAGRERSPITIWNVPIPVALYNFGDNSETNAF